MIEGKITADNGEKITLSIKGGQLFIQHKDIESIIKSEYIPEETPNPQTTDAKNQIPIQINPISPTVPTSVGITPTPTAVVTPTKTTTFTITDEGKEPEQIEINNLLRKLLDEPTKEPWQTIRTLSEKGKKDISYLIELLNNTKDPALTRWIIYTLGEIKDEQAIQPLMEKLGDPDETIRSMVVKSLGHFNNLKIRPILKSLLETETSVSVRNEIVDAFTEWRDPSIITSLINLLSDKENQTRQSAASALIKFARLPVNNNTESSLPDRQAGPPDQSAGIPDFIPSLIDKVKTASISGGRKEIISVLGQVKDKRALEVLTEMLIDKDAETRGLAAMALGNIANKDTINLLLERLKEEKDLSAKIRIIDALQKNPDYSMIPDLIELLNDSNENFRLLVARALRVITKRSFGANYESWKYWYDTTQGK